ncbi:MAG: sigma-70 family RNA polymerase sigma factor [bacterium]|nr:sigma-70 family RNA polymerase sigma factor [Bacillota bacterium]HHW55529.1 sigma-70 family RNA polymerase sigma factor [Bacillota bacterium]
MLEKLLYQAQGGDRAALAEIVRRFQPLVLATARRLAAEGVEWLDLVQEGNLALMEAVFAFNPRGRAGFPWYARRRVYFALFNYRRDNLRLQERETLTLDLPLEEGEGATLLDLLPAEGEGPEDVVLARSRDQELHLALARLPEKQRRVLKALYWEGKGVSELAREMGIAPSSVKGLENRGLKNLARFLGREG